MHFLGEAALPLMLVLNSFGVDSANRRVKKVGKTSPGLDYNSSYYQQPFALCKKAKKMHPVEEMRAQAFATRVFAKCGSATVIKYAEAWKLPAFAIHGIGNLNCFGARVGYAFAANDGSTTLKDREQSKIAFKFFETFIVALLKIHHVFRLRLGKDVHWLPMEKTAPMMREAAACAIVGTGQLQKDVDYLLHTVHYYKFLLL